MPNYIPEDFQPNDRSYKNLKKHGAPREFLDSQFDYFMTYWLEQKEKQSAKGKKESWQMTWQRWMRSAWQGKAGREWEANRERQCSNRNGGLKTDLFDTALQYAREKGRPCVDERRPVKQVPPTGTESRERVNGGREIDGRDSSNPIGARSADGCLPSMKPEEAFAQLRKDGVIK